MGCSEGVIHGLYECRKRAEEEALKVPNAYAANINEMECALEHEIQSCTCKYRCSQCLRCYDCGKKRTD